MDAQRSHSAIGWRQNVNRLFSFVFCDVLFEIEDILLNLVQTKPGDPLVSGYSSLNFDLSALFIANVGQNLRLRFAEADNLFTFQI